MSHWKGLLIDMEAERHVFLRAIDYSLHQHRLIPRLIQAGALEVLPRSLSYYYLMCKALDRCVMVVESPSADGRSVAGSDGSRYAIIIANCPL